MSHIVMVWFYVCSYSQTFQRLSKKPTKQEINVRVKIFVVNLFCNNVDIVANISESIFHWDVYCFPFILFRIAAFTARKSS